MLLDRTVLKYRFGPACCGLFSRGIGSPLFAKYRLRDQGPNHRRNLEPERSPFAKGVFADHRVLKPGLDIDRHFAKLDRLADKEPDRDIPFVPGLGLIVVGGG